MVLRVDRERVGFVSDRAETPSRDPEGKGNIQPPMRLWCHDHPEWPCSTWAITAEDLERARQYVHERGWVRHAV